MNLKKDAQQTTSDLETIDCSKTHQIGEFKHEISLTTLRVDPTSRFVAAGAEDLDVQLWSLEAIDRRLRDTRAGFDRSISRPTAAVWSPLVGEAT